MRRRDEFVASLSGRGAAVFSNCWFLGGWKLREPSPSELQRAFSRVMSCSSVRYPSSSLGEEGRKRCRSGEVRGCHVQVSVTCLNCKGDMLRQIPLTKDPKQSSDILM